MPTNIDDTKRRTEPSLFDRPDSQLFQDFSILDADEAIIKWFKELDLYIIKSNGEKIEVPVEYVSGERWKKAEIEKGLLDSKKNLILPLIIITRRNLVPNIQRRVQKHDSTRRIVLNKPLSQMSRDFMRKFDNPSTKVNVNTTVYRVIKIPLPTYFDLQYDVKLMTNFISHSNQLIEGIYPDNIYVWIASDKGYGFHATLSEPTTDEIGDMKEEERLIVNTLTITAQSFIIRKDTSNSKDDDYYIIETPTRVEIEEKIKKDYYPPLGTTPQKTLPQ